MKKVAWIALLLIALGMISLSLLPKNDSQDSYHLVFHDNDANKTLLTIPIEIGKEMSVGYTHSLYKTKQWEFYKITEDGSLILDRLEFESADAADYFEHDTQHAYKSSELKYGNWAMERNEVLDKVFYRIPYLHPMIVEYNEQQYDLREIGQSGHQVMMHLQRG